jgi:putative redox protein
MPLKTEKISFPGSQGFELAARLDFPSAPPRAFALFAHCFTCSKQVLAAKYIASELAKLNIAVLRFDFTGLGSSDGEFANTNFSSNIQDLIAAADFLRENYAAPTLIIGHSLGGAAVLAAAGDIPEVKGVVTIGAPADAEHVIHNFGRSIDQIEKEGEAEVVLAGRTFTIQKQFLEDVQASTLEEKIANLRRGLLILHSPIDQVVGVENASRIFMAARHPKSFVSLDQSDHLLSKPQDAIYAARIIAGWASRYLEPEAKSTHKAIDNVVVAETGEGKFQNSVFAGPHSMLADEPVSVGGLDSGPSPYDYLAIALGACTSMTIRMYADFKKIKLGAVSVEVKHAKVHADDCFDCADSQKSRGGKIDRFERLITIEGGVASELESKILMIADKCPVHKTLESGTSIVTRIVK